jgi:hypothetical protein
MQRHVIGEAYSSSSKQHGGKEFRQMLAFEVLREVSDITDILKIFCTHNLAFEGIAYLLK